LPLEARLGLALGRALDGVAQIVRGPKTERARASLEGGFPGYLSRRSRGFRRSARRSTRRLEAEGVTFEAPGFDRPWPEVYQRVLSVDGRSWKGRDGVGIGQGAMRRFYEEMGTRLWRQRSLRVLFARREGRDVAYHFGAVLGDLYRGLQHAYDEALRPLGLGAATHLEMIRRVAGEGIAIYDLGQEIAYKARWAELGLVTQTLYLTRSAPPGSPGKARP
jgi:CelD/BcsL family acetyltransferase involved in cellulose biosynthesis